MPGVADDETVTLKTIVCVLSILSPFVLANKQILGELKLIVQFLPEELTIDCPVIVKPLGSGILNKPILFEVAVAVKFNVEPGHIFELPAANVHVMASVKYA